MKRRLSLVALLAIGGLFLVLGWKGWVVNDLLPAHYLGAVFLVVFVLGLSGVNVWRSGPLDPRLDWLSQPHDQDE